MWETNCMVVSGDTVAIEVIETGTFTEPWTWQGKTLRPNGKGYRARISVFFRVNKDGLIQDIEEEGTGIVVLARCRVPCALRDFSLTGRGLIGAELREPRARAAPPATQSEQKRLAVR